MSLGTPSIDCLELLGLEDVISIGAVDPIRPTDVDRTDWAFTLDKDGRDPVLGIHYLSDIYLKQTLTTKDVLQFLL